jgi:hypothetical protein
MVFLQIVWCYYGTEQCQSVRPNVSMYHNTKQQDIKDHDPQVGGRGSRFWRPIWKTIDDEFLHVGWNLEK